MPPEPAAVLTFDLGTSATKGALWRGTRLVALARAPLDTTHPRPGWAEQDPDGWWASVTEVCAELRAATPEDYAAVDSIGFSAARETFALFDAGLEPLAPGILWSDRRAADDAAALGDPGRFRATTGVVLNGAAHAAKLAWVAREMPDVLARARWILEPRDLVVARLTGEVVTDETLASRTGLCALGGGWLDEARAAYGDRLPPIVAAAALVGPLTTDAAGALGLTPRARVVVGAGDRACEVLGTGASPSAPMASWGTTVNVSVPHDGPVDALPTTAAVSRGALGGFVVEAGLSAAGSALGWLATLTGVLHDDLLSGAAAVDPGADGLLALPWFSGARGPWWNADAHGAFIGLTEAHGPAALARAVVEGIALDAARCHRAGRARRRGADPGRRRLGPLALAGDPGRRHRPPAGAAGASRRGVRGGAARGGGGVRGGPRPGRPQPGRGAGRARPRSRRGLPPGPGGLRRGRRRRPRALTRRPP